MLPIQSSGLHTRGAVSGRGHSSTPVVLRPRGGSLAARWWAGKALHPWGMGPSLLLVGGLPHLLLACRAQPHLSLLSPGFQSEMWVQFASHSLQAAGVCVARPLLPEGCSGCADLGGVLHTQDTAPRPAKAP